MKMEYVVGFLFNEELSHVVLIRKNRPDFQAGKLNGVGGKIEHNEFPLEAMAREFFEETGWEGKIDWKLFLTVSKNKNERIFYFTAKTNDLALKQTTDEFVAMFHSSYALMDKVVLDGKITPVMPNLKWAIPLAIDNFREEKQCGVILL